MGEARRKAQALENTPLRIDYGNMRDASGKVTMVRMRFDRLVRYVDFKPEDAIRAAQSLAVCAAPLPEVKKNVHDAVDDQPASGGGSGAAT